MYYFLVTINIVNDDDTAICYKRYNFVCPTLRKALECAKHKAKVYDLRPLYEDKRMNKWKKDYNQYYKNYWDGYITIEKKQMWEKPGD